jgi:putative DNA methylase
MTPKKKLIEVALPNLAFLVSKLADKGSTICTWDVGPTSSRTASGRSARVATVRVTFARQGIPMTWDFAEGKPLSVREALALINQTLDEALAKQEGDFDAGSRWALAWFEQSGFEAGEYGVAETLSKAKNTSVAGMVEASVLASKGGKVRLLRPDELPADWDPETDPRLTAWESVHHLVRALEAGGENAAADLVAKIGSKAEIARELAYRLYTVCERKKRAQEALSYNGLVQSWPEITRLARESGKPQRSQPQLFDQE